MLGVVFGLIAWGRWQETETPTDLGTGWSSWMKER